MSTQPPKTSGPDEPSARNRCRDFWQLDVPLVLVLLLCAAITVVEMRRAGEGVWRAWFYMFEWPAIGAFAIWIWYRFRTEGNPAKTATRRWRERVAQAQADFDAAEGAQPPAEPDDPQLRAWREYVDDLQRRDPPGGPDVDPGAAPPRH